MVDTHTVEQCKNEGRDVEEQQKAKEGCVIHGSLGVNKVAGNFHFAPGKSLTSVAISAAGLIQFQRTDHNVSIRFPPFTLHTRYPSFLNATSTPISNVSSEETPEVTSESRVKGMARF
jgi:hypothetical protein